MYHAKRLFKLRKACLLTAAVLFMIPVSSCAVFSYRAHRWEQQVTRDPDGVLSHARARTWEGTGPSLLLVHGFGDGPHVWNSLGPELAEAGYHVRAMRLPGWNEPIDVKKEVSRDDWRQAVLEEASELAVRNEPVVLIAHSLGACLVTDLLQGGQVGADAVVLYAPLFRVSNARSPVFSSRTWFHIGRRVLPDSFIVESVFKEQAQDGTSRPATERDPFNPKNIFVELFELMNEREAKPARISCPVYLVVAEQDRVINTPVALEWFDQLETPSKQFRMDPIAGHALPLDLDTVAETEHLLNWFAEQGITP